MNIHVSVNGYSLWIVAVPFLIYLAIGAAVFATNRPLRQWWKLAFHRFAPVYFLGLPPILFYFFICGSVSVLAALVCGLAFPGLMPPRGNGILHVYKAVEWIVGFFGMWLCARAIDGVQLPRLWFLWTVSIMGIVAGYREARIDALGEMGPKIADSFDWFDASIPFLAAGVYLAVVRRAKSPPANSPSPAADSPSPSSS